MSPQPGEKIFSCIPVNYETDDPEVLKELDRYSYDNMTKICAEHGLTPIDKSIVWDGPASDAPTEYNIPTYLGNQRVRIYQGIAQ